MLIAGDVKNIHVTRLSYSGAAAIVTRLSLGVLWLAGVVWLVAAHGHAASPPPPPSLSPLEQAFSQIVSEDEAVREAALRVVIEQGDSTVIPRLEDIRATADRPIRLAIKPVMDLLKNRAKLESPEADVRRSAATDLGTLGRPVAIPWLEQAAAKETNKWVRYTMQESAALLKLAGDDQAAKLAAVSTLGDLASQNAVPAIARNCECRNSGRGERTSTIPGQGRPCLNRTHRNLGGVVGRDRNAVPWRQPQLDSLDHVGGARNHLRAHGRDQYGPW